jgi:hypothetical protein
VVFDTDVVIGGAGWRAEPHECLVLAAKRLVFPYATGDTEAELRAVAERLQAAGEFKRNP